MSNSNEKQYYVEITRHTLQAIRTAGGTIEFCGECAIDQKAAVEATLAGWSNGARARAVAIVTPSRVHWHLSSADEAARHRTEAALRTFAATLPHGFDAPLELTTCLAEEGSSVGSNGKGRWLLGVVPAETLNEATTLAAERNFDVARLESATMARVGGALAAIRHGGSGPVLLWELNLETSQLLLVTSRGVEAVIPCTAGLDALFGAVQTALGLKMRGAAARLFFNDTYDFNDAGPRIAADLAPALKTAIASVPAAASASALACLGITSKQGWFAREIARAVGLAPFAPDMSKVLNHLQLRTGAEELAPDALGLLHTASSHHRQSTLWHPAWSKPGSAPIVSEKASPAPAPAKPAPAPSSSGSSSTVIKAVTVTDVPRNSPQPATAGGVAVAVLPEVKPQTKAAPAVAAASQAKPEIKATAKTQVQPARKTEVPPAKAAKPATPPTPPAKAAPAPAAAAPAPTPAAAPAPATKRRGFGLYIGIAAGLAFAGLAGKFYFDAQAAKQVAEQEKVAAAEQMRVAEARARELELQAKAEAERIRREAEAARETAVALARQQAEEQTRQKISAELDAERIAKSPGILIVTTSPVGASVSIDGGPARTAPLSINDILPGRHRVAISLAGYEPVELTADILGTKTTDLGLIQLERATGTLALNSTPEQLEFSIRPAGISLGGPLRQGRTPAQIDDLPPGDYVVTFSQPGWRDQVVNVTIEKRETAQIAAKFIGGAAMLTSVPTGAAVKRNGVVVGRTPLTLSELPPENASFEFSLPDHEPVVLSGDVVEGKQLKLEARLLHVDRIAPSSEIAVNPQPYEQPAPRIGATTAIVPPEVKVSFVVWRDGTPRDIQVLGKVDKDIAADCTTAVAKWKFHPARNRDGRPLNVRVTLPIKIVAENL